MCGKVMRYDKLLFFFTLFLCSCCGKASGNTEGGEVTPPAPEPSQAVVTAYVTTADKTLLFKSEELELRKPGTMAVNLVTLDSTVTFQTVDGFGPALTGSTCYNLRAVMEPSARTALLKELFDPKEGLGFSMVRVTIGSSDFGLDEYTWCDKKGMENFAAHEYDVRDLFPILKEVLAINPDVKIIATPWTAPRWMKRRVNNDSDYYSWTSGRLKPECYQDYAEYFVRWIRVMKSQGFDIYAVTLQNEPLNKGNSMSMYMPWQEQLEFIKTAVGPAFGKAGLNTKILVYDHNYNYDGIADQQGYPMNILADTEAARYVAGSAWHNYYGNPKELDKMVSRFPDKEIYFTEASIGGWAPDFAKCLMTDFDNIFIQTLSRENKGVTLWNLVLDENYGPKRPGGCQNCYGVVMIDSKTGKVTDRKTQYYNLAHASKVIRPGARRIATKGNLKSGVSCLAFLNPDHSYGIIIENNLSESHSFTFSDSGHSVKFTAPAKSIASIKWNN